MIGWEEVDLAVGLPRSKTTVLMILSGEVCLRSSYSGRDSRGNRMDA